MSDVITPESQSSAPISSPVEQATILVVDDNPTNIKVLCDFLSHCNYRIAVAQSGEKALQKVDRIFPDLILLDVMMPGMDGFETCRRLKENPQSQNIPILFMTALTDSVNKVKGLNLGAVDYITKPIEYEETLARIKIHIALRKAQIRLIEEEKMAALGQLVAGVAHEINNPVNFIQGNLAPAEDYVEALLELIRLHETHPSPLAAACDYAQEIDLDFIRKDFRQLIKSMQMGTERIQKIVQSLRTFSRLDESEYKSIDVHHGLDSTLIILESRLKGHKKRDNIQVVKNYNALPAILCYPGKLNQVFMNLLVNAIDAIDEKFVDEKFALSDRPLSDDPNLESPTITISTAIANNQVIIRIADSGMGIPKNVQKKIFEQFFTTKSIGKGTGLGLAICRTIIAQDHQGSLTFQSQVGKGTEFTITLPATPPVWQSSESN